MAFTQPNIGVLFTEAPINRNEQRYGLNIWESLELLNANPVAIDYYRDIDVQRILNHAAIPAFLSQYGKLFRSDDRDYNQNLLEKFSALIEPHDFLENDKLVSLLAALLPDVEKEKFLGYVDKAAAKSIKKKVEQIIEERNITGIFLPGDSYNYDKEPYHPEPKARPRLTRALLEIAKEKNIPLMGVCGGLQGPMYMEGISIKRVADMVGEENARNHVISESDPTVSNELLDLSQTLRRTKVEPNTRVGNVIKSVQGITSNEKFPVKHLFFYAPEAHGGAIDISQENIQKLEERGYRITAKSPDGIIQGVEHKHYPIHLFQNHPEDMVRLHDPLAKAIFKRLLVEPAKEIALEAKGMNMIAENAANNWVERIQHSTQKNQGMAIGG